MSLDSRNRPSSTDPLGGGASLDDIRTQYEQARARYIGARLDKQERLVALGYELQHSHLTRVQQTELIKEVLAGKGNIPDLEHQFIKAKNAYAFAITAVSNSLDDVRADLAAQRKDFAQDLHRRGEALSRAGKECEDFADDLLNFAFFPPAEEAWYMFLQLAGGFRGIADGFNAFAGLVEGRKLLYDRDAERIEAEGKRLAADKN
jgi:hypothetical protein